jgi:hypothetical protein
MISRMNGVDKVTVSVRQNDTSVFLIGDILRSDYKVADL